MNKYTRIVKDKVLKRPDAKILSEHKYYLITKWTNDDGITYCIDAHMYGKDSGFSDTVDNLPWEKAISEEQAKEFSEDENAGNKFLVDKHPCINNFLKIHNLSL